MTRPPTWQTKREHEQQTHHRWGSYETSAPLPVHQIGLRRRSAWMWCVGLAMATTCLILVTVKDRSGTDPAVDRTSSSTEVLQVVDKRDRVIEEHVTEYAPPALEPDGNDGRKDEETDRREEDEGLPQCYSTPSADPSRGEWDECAGGIRESPADMVEWVWENGEYRYYKRCARRWKEKQGEAKVMPYWKWTPQNCTLDDLDAEKFCHLVEGKKGILFVGDSLTRIMASTLASVLRAEVAPQPSLGQVDEAHEQSGRGGNGHRAGVGKGGANPPNGVVSDNWSACGGALKVSYYRNDHLDTRTVAFPTRECDVHDISSTRCMVFADDATLKSFDVLIVNAGAHTRKGGMEEYGEAMRKAALVLTESMRRWHGQNATLVVRNTVPGHWDCDARIFDGPVSEDLALRLVADAPNEYHWSDFQGYNELLEQAFEDADGGWTLLDAYSPTLLRADSHHGLKEDRTYLDCLHYCVPGPVDHWVILLYNILVAKSNERTS